MRYVYPPKDGIIITVAWEMDGDGECTESKEMANTSPPTDGELKEKARQLAEKLRGRRLNALSPPIRSL